MADVAELSFGLCALAFLGLTVMLLRRRGAGAAALLLTAAAAATALWAALLALVPFLPALPAYAGQALEWLRSGAWIAFLTVLLGGAAGGRYARVLRVVAALALMPPLLVVIASATGERPVALGEGVEAAFVPAGLGVAVVGLLLLEQVYRNMVPERRWALKHLCLGIALLFAYDIYLYADAILFGRLDAVIWDARGAVNALAVPLVAVSAARNRSWSVDVFVSRHVAFHTTTLVAVGGYLIVMALGGYYIRDFGGTWGSFFQIVFVAAAAVALLVVLASTEARTRLRVFLTKHFFSNKYDYREEWLRLIRRLSEEDDGLSAPQRAVCAVAQIFESPWGAVWLQRDEEALVPAGAWRFRVPEGATLAPDHPLARFLGERRWIIELAEYDAYPERYEGLELPDWVNTVDRAWVIIPLLHRDRLLGLMILARPHLPVEITWEDRDLLKTLGLQIAIYLAQHENARALSESRQFEAFNRFTAFLMHDLKNLIAQQSLVVRNAEKFKHDPEFVDDAMHTVGRSVERMERLLEHLRRRQAGGNAERVRLDRLLGQVVERCADRAPAPSLKLLSDSVYVEADPDGLMMVLIHVVRNAQDATPEDGDVSVVLETGPDMAIVECRDSGEGMDEAFIRDELFRPFHTTKSSKGMGIGAHQAREFVRASGGRVEVSSMPGRGTSFRIVLPLLPGQEQNGVVEQGDTDTP